MLKAYRTVEPLKVPFTRTVELFRGDEWGMHKKYPMIGTGGNDSYGTQEPPPEGAGYGTHHPEWLAGPQ